MTNLAITSTEVNALILDPAPLGYDTEGDMLKVSARIGEMTPEENDRIFGSMSDRELSVWAERVYAPGTLGVGEGLSADQRLEMFGNLSVHFSGALQARLMTKFNRQSGEQLALGTQIALHATPANKLAFIESAARDVAGPERSFDHGMVGQTVSLWPNETGVAVAKVLVSLKDSPREFNAAIASLGEQGKLGEVVEAALGLTQSGDDNYLSQTPFGGDPSGGASYDPRLLRNMVDAARTAGSAESRVALANSVESLQQTMESGVSDLHGHSFPKPARDLELKEMVARLRSP